jgi:4,5-DOPA dioxygenase extradiol
MIAAPTMPAVFFGHGNPLNAIEDTAYSRAWNALGQTLPRPRAILFVSAHWFVHRTAVTATADPPTIHDFTGFPKALYDVRYPAKGDPRLAAEVAEMLAPIPVTLDTSWGLDHGAWSVLVHVFPKADVPVVEFSVNAALTPKQHFDLGARLGELRSKDVLLMASGNIVHNLQYFRLGAGAPHDWATRFDAAIAGALERRDDAALIDYRAQPDAQLAAPDYDHFAPVLYIAGARRASDTLRFITEGIDAGSVSMRSFVVA